MNVTLIPWASSIASGWQVVFQGAQTRHYRVAAWARIHGSGRFAVDLGFGREFAIVKMKLPPTNGFQAARPIRQSAPAEWDKDQSTDLLKSIEIGDVFIGQVQDTADTPQEFDVIDALDKDQDPCRSRSGW